MEAQLVLWGIGVKTVGHQVVGTFHKTHKTSQCWDSHILVLDGDGSPHKTIAAIGIVMFWLPPHMMHELQPLDGSNRLLLATVLHFHGASVCVSLNLSPECKLQQRMEQESLAIAKTTAQCAQYMGALKSFESSRKRPRLLFPKFVKGFCSDRY